MSHSNDTNIPVEGQINNTNTPADSQHINTMIPAQRQRNRTLAPINTMRPDPASAAMDVANVGQNGHLVLVDVAVGEMPIQPVISPIRAGFDDGTPSVPFPEMSEDDIDLQAYIDSLPCRDTVEIWTENNENAVALRDLVESRVEQWFGSTDNDNASSAYRETVLEDVDSSSTANGSSTDSNTQDWNAPVDTATTTPEPALSTPATFIPFVFAGAPATATTEAIPPYRTRLSPRTGAIIIDVDDSIRLPVHHPNHVPLHTLWMYARRHYRGIFHPEDLLLPVPGMPPPGGHPQDLFSRRYAAPAIAMGDITNDMIGNMLELPKIHYSTPFARRQGERRIREREERRAAEAAREQAMLVAFGEKRMRERMERAERGERSRMAIEDAERKRERASSA